MALVRNETFGVLSIEPSGPYGLLEVAEVTESADLPWPDSGPVAQTYACGDLQPVGHACMPGSDQLAAPTNFAVTVLPEDPEGPPVVEFDTYITAIDACGETLPVGPVTVSISEAQASDPDFSMVFTFDEVEGATGYHIYDNRPDLHPDTGYGRIDVTGSPREVPQDEAWPGAPLPTENTTCAEGLVPDKRFDGLESVDGTFVTIQGGLTCGAMGLSGPDALQYARGLFEAREGAAVEREFLMHILAGAEDITPAAGPVSATVGLALAEGYAISNYAGRPYIHAPSTIGSYLFARGAAKIEGVSRTKLNNPLVVGGGYDYPSVGPDGEPAEDGTYWLYVTGRPVIVRGALGVYESMNYTTNDEVALAERPYVLAVDCFAAAINVTLEG